MELFMRRAELTIEPSIHASPDCWVDIFDADYFMGRRRRVNGPQKLPQLEAKSLIVGPKAVVVLSVGHGKRKSEIRLKSKRVVPDLAKSLKGAKFRAAAVQHVK
jgi:hypothetical protein